MPVMLATAGRELAEQPIDVINLLVDQGEWTFEVKLDGIRATLTTGGHITLRSRRGASIGWRYPDILGRLGDTNRQIVLDGEIVALNPKGVPDYAAAHRRDTQRTEAAAQALSRSIPVVHIAFDLLELDGLDLRQLPYLERRSRLEELSSSTPGIMVFPVSPDGHRMWELVEEWDLEGLVAKRNDSRYVERRSRDWVKIKSNRQLLALVTGHEPGQGSRASTFGALHVALVETDGTLRPVGKVGSGFSEFELKLISARLAVGGAPMIVRVEYLEVGPGPTGQLRFPVFRGIAPRATLEDATVSQLAPPVPDGRPLS